MCIQGQRRNQIYLSLHYKKLVFCPFHPFFVTSADVIELKCLWGSKCHILALSAYQTTFWYFIQEIISFQLFVQSVQPNSIQGIVLSSVLLWQKDNMLINPLAFSWHLLLSLS